MSKHSARRHPASRNNRRQAIAAKTARPKEATITTNRKPDGNRLGMWDGPLAALAAAAVVVALAPSTVSTLHKPVASWGTHLLAQTSPKAT